MPDRALEGLRVVECGDRVGATYAGKLMADLGAEVVKVEVPRLGHSTRRRGPFPGGEPHPEKSGLFLYLNCNKRGVTLDLTTPAGRDLLYRLVAHADVLVQDYLPREAEARGVTFDRLREVNPRLVMASASPFGQTGPYRDYNAYEITMESAGGWTWLNGWPNRQDMPPLKPFGFQAEYQAGVSAAVATLGALFSRLRSGKGQHIDVSAQECIASITEMSFAFWSYTHTPAVRWGRRPLQPIDFFECKDGAWVFALCLEEHQWRGLVELMGDPEWTQWEVAANAFVRASNWDALRPFMAEWVSQWNADDLYRAAQEKRIPFAPVSTMGSLLESEHLKARGFFVEVAHPEAGRLRYPGAPYKLSGTPWEVRSPAPALGQHNEALFRDRLGLSPQEFASLREGGVI